MSIPSGGEGIADFAAVGDASVCVKAMPTGAQGLEYTWEGQDNASGSSDDVEFDHQPTASDPCVESVPSGGYSVDVVSPSGDRMRTLSIDVEPGVQRLDPVTGAVTVIALPATGLDAGGTSERARWIILVGLGLLLVTRRRLGVHRLD